MWESMKYMPEWFIDESIWEESDKQMKKMYEFEPLRKSKEELDSTTLNDKYRYFPQIETIKQCLEEVFWKNIRFIIIRNRFLFTLEELVDSYNSIQNDKENPDLKSKFEFHRSDMASYLHDNWIEFFERLEEQNPNLWFQELSKLRITYKNKFIDLLLERIQYIPNK